MHVTDQELGSLQFFRLILIVFEHFHQLLPVACSTIERFGNLRRIRLLAAA